MIDNLFQTVKKLSIAIYARLSKEEEGKSSEEKSRSIINQIQICRKYIKEEQTRYPNCQFEIIYELYDDGISGTTFDRNSFKILINLIESKKINMIITKDLSRLGRDHIITDDYIEKWFPKHNVRYVSIMENIDTYADCLSNDIAPIINWSNEHFAKLTSKKIRRQFDIMRKEGKWTGGEPPLGYKIDECNKYHLVIDEKTSSIVKKIFELAKTNKSLNEISKILMEEKIPIPTLLKGNKRNLNKELSELWKPVSIKLILKNEIYLGHMIQGKTTRLNHKSRTIIFLPKDNWIKVENTHEAIIDQVTFDIVQKLLNTNKNKTVKTSNYSLRGLLKCYECHHIIGIQHYNNRKYVYTICNYYRKYGSKKKVCTAHRFKYEDIENKIINNLKSKIFKNISKEKLVSIIKDKIRNNDKYGDIQRKINNCKNNIKKYKYLIDIIYEDKINGIIDEEMFIRKTNDKKQLIESKERELLMLEKEKLLINKKDLDVKIIDNFLNMKFIDKKILVMLIDKIYLSQNGDLEIYYRFKNPNM